MIVDTSILYAAADRRDAAHEAAVAALVDPEPKIAPEAVLVEAGWLIGSRLGTDAEVAFLAGLEELVAIEPPTPSDRARAAELVSRYRDAALGSVDAVTVAIAERVGERRIATLDRRDFTLVTPRHVDAFEIIP